MKRANPFTNPGSAERRRKARVAAGLSRSQAAKEISPTTQSGDVQRWETLDDSRPALNAEYQRMADAYGVSLDYLEHGTLACFADVMAEYHDAPEEIRLAVMKRWSQEHPTE